MSDSQPGAPIPSAAAPYEEPTDRDGMWLVDGIVGTLRQHAVALAVGTMLSGALALGIAFLIPPTFTARTAILPPQGGQSATLSALASLSPLAGLAVGSGGARNVGEQYVALLQSVTIAERLVERFQLVQRYDVRFRVDARKELAENSRMTLGRRDGVIVIEASDKDPKVAAEIANTYVEELRRLTSSLAVSEAQQRRVFFEQQLKQSRDALAKAQESLQSGGFDPEAIKAEPKAAAEGYARLKANAAAAEVRLKVLRNTLSEEAPEVRQQLAALGALRTQLAAAERGNTASVGADYISRYREFKYQETLFELYARQFEVARVDESREGALIQVLDVATPPERKSKPRRLVIAVLGAGIGFVALLAGLVWRRSTRPTS